MRQPGVLLLSLGTAVTVLAAPASETPAGGAAPARSMTFYHWWSTPAEMTAISALVDTFKKRHAGLVATPFHADSPGGGGKMFSVIRSAASSAKPPDAFQVHSGAPLRPYFDAGLLSPLDRIWTDEELEKVVPSLVQTMSRIDGRYYSVPIDVHRTNVLWYNKRILDKHGIDPASLTSWKALFEAADKVRDGGLRDPFHVGQNWTVSIVLESIMASLGMSAYEDWINGRITAEDDSRLLEAYGLLRTYLSYATNEQAGLPLVGGLRRFIDGQSAFCIMGDWANGEFSKAGMKYGKDYGAIPSPGTRGLYAVSVDSFAQTRGLADPTGSERWLRVVASRDGQDAFNVAKGSIPARIDADAARYDAYQRSAIADFKGARIHYPSIANATHDAFKAALDDVMRQFRADLDVKKAAAATARAAARSAKKFTQVWSLR
jgi:glucose/mannose transport system substrate-binding protein